MNVRKIALKLLLEHEGNGTFVNLSLQNHNADSLPADQRAFLTALLYTSVERKITLDYLIGALASRSPDSLDVTTKSILRLGLCQLLYMKRIPEFAAVNETVKLCHSQGERRFVNFVLREALRRIDALPYPPREKNAARYLSVFYSVPLWIVKTLMRELGEEGAEQYLIAINREAPLTIAVNTTKISRDEYARLLDEASIRYEKTERSPLGIRIFDHVRIPELVGFDDGYFFVQDEASQLVALVLSPEQGDRIVDVCACPGGKSFAAAILANDRAEIFSFDLHESKLPLVSDGAARLGLSSIRAEMHDATVARADLVGEVDRVICDVPCSGLGVLSKKPDLRYKTEESVAPLADLGYRILCASASYVKPQGVLVFSTCTVRREENEEVVCRFLSEHDGFALEVFSVGECQYKDGMLRTWVHTDGTDGFFIAKLRRL